VSETQETYTEAQDALMRAVDAREGDSNDEEIEALWEAVESLASLAAMPLPLPRVTRTIRVNLTGRLTDADVAAVSKTLYEALSNARFVHHPKVEEFMLDFWE
jgi:hypothetical protein